MQVPRKKTKISHTISAKFLAGFIANSHPEVSAIAQSRAGLGREKFSQMRARSVMQRLHWPKLPRKNLAAAAKS